MIQIVILGELKLAEFVVPLIIYWGSGGMLKMFSSDLGMFSLV